MQLSPDKIQLDTQDLTLEQLHEFLVVKYSPEKRIEVMRKFCVESVSVDIQKKGMQFLYMHEFYDDLRILINKNLKSNQLSNRQWAEVYQLSIEYIAKNLFYDIIQKLEQIKTDEPELICIIELFKIRVFYDMDTYSNVNRIFYTYQDLFDSIEDKLFVSYMRIYLHSLLTTYFLHRNELIISRKQGYRALTLLTEVPRRTVEVHMNLGLSYIFESFNQGMIHFNIALKIAKKYQMSETIERIENKFIPLISAQFNHVENMSSNIKTYQAHIEIAKGNNQKAIEILSGLPLDDPYLLFCLGKAKQDKQLLCKSYKYYKERSNHFLARLPMKEIRKMP